MADFEARRSSYDGELYLSLRYDIERSSEVARDLFRHMSRYAIRRASDLMVKDEQTDNDRKNAIEYLERASMIERMLDQMAELEKEEASDDKA